MPNLIIDIPDDLARSIEGIAAAQHVTVQQLALDRLRPLVQVGGEHPAGSPAAVLPAMLDEPHLAASDVEELEAAIAAGRTPSRERDLFLD